MYSDYMLDLKVQIMLTHPSLQWLLQRSLWIR